MTKKIINLGYSRRDHPGLKKTKLDFKGPLARVKEYSKTIGLANPYKIAKGKMIFLKEKDRIFF